MKKLAVSYARWSDPKQDTGDSRTRQEQDYRSFVQQHNLTPSGQAFTDEGTSGFRGRHRQKGQLKELVEAAQAGTWEKGTIIVVEAWDRLGRMIPNKQIRLIEELLETGVSIGIVRLNDTFTYADFGSHKWTILSTFVMLAYQESLQKSDRVKRAWKNRRDRVREGQGSLPCVCPAWCEVTAYERGKGGQLRLVPERAEAIRRIFELAAQGYGLVRIVQTLIQEGRAPFAGGHWSRAYVRLILSDRRALGELQLCDREGNADGPPVKSYLPAVVSEEEFALARAGMLARKGTRDRVPTAKRKAHFNLFKGLLRHARDGGSFYLRDPGPHVKGLVLRTSTGDDGRGKNYTFPYLPFEGAILKLLKELNPADVLPGGKDTPGLADVLRAKLAAIRQDLAGLQADLKEGYSKALSTVLREKEIEEEQIATRLQEELAKAARHAERDWEELPNLAALVKEGGDEARLRLRPVLRRVVSGMWILPVRRGSYLLVAVQIYFADSDARRNYLIVHQATGFNRPGGGWAESFAKAGLPEALDLRRRDHVRQLERDLAAFEL
jgi:DNA invertase Pin-like site-specific DNA recombinase